MIAILSSTKETISGELMENIYEKMNTYHSLEKKYGFENSMAPVSMAAISEKYQEMLKNGQITTKTDN